MVKSKIRPLQEPTRHFNFNGEIIPPIILKLIVGPSGGLYVDFILLVTFPLLM